MKVDKNGVRLCDKRLCKRAGIIGVGGVWYCNRHFPGLPELKKPKKEPKA